MSTPDYRYPLTPELIAEQQRFETFRNKHDRQLEDSGLARKARRLVQRGYLGRALQAPYSAHADAQPAFLGAEEHTRASIRRTRLTFGHGIQEWGMARYALELTTRQPNEEIPEQVERIIIAEKYHDMVAPCDPEQFTWEEAESVVALADELEAARQTSLPHLVADLTHISPPQAERAWNANFPIH